MLCRAFTHYFHIVFTVPAPVAEIALQNKRIIYDIIFKTAAETIRIISADPKHLGAETGMIAVLHTWGQTLTHHPHAHCIIPGGGLTPDGRWINFRPNFFLPVRVLSRLYRRLFLEHLQAAFDHGDLQFFGDLVRVVEPSVFADHIESLRRVEWVVFAKRPFGDPEHVTKYLGRYTHRVAIANSRLLEADNESVRFRWKDYRAYNKPKAMTLQPFEFIRRFLLHVTERLPPHPPLWLFGKCLPRHKACRIRNLLNAPPPTIVEPPDYRERYAILTGHRLDQCTLCGGRMVDVIAWSWPEPPPHSVQPCDTS
jgi:Putative transposase